MKVDISKEWCVAMAEKEAEAGDPDFSIPLRESNMTDEQIKHMVDRFLMWKLPANFSPDNGVSFDKHLYMPAGQVREPVGTNLLDASQATAMVRHMIEGLPRS